jgi:glycosyltransferase involved in cell wall biosynthesis
MNKIGSTGADWPLVSVILPTYNRAPYLPTSIESVLTQSYSHFELIIVDDGSKDETGDILKQIVDQRVRCNQLEKNHGEAGARNAGLQMAKGEYIAFIDSDDKWLPGKLLTQVKTLNKYKNLDMLFGDYLNINYITGITNNGFSQTKKGLAILKTRNLSGKVYQIMAGFAEGILISNFVAPSTVIIRSRVYNNFGGFLPKLRAGVDKEFWWRASLHGAKIGFINEILTERHKDEGSLSAQLIFICNMIDSLDECRRIAEKFHEHKLLKLIDNVKHQTWQNLVKENAKIGKRQEAFKALRESLRYGICWRPFLYFGAALCGPALIKKMQKIKDF